MNSKCYDTALHLLDKGVSIIPIKPASKKPMVRWKEFQSRLATKEEVHAWFEMEPDANLAIVTGEISSIVVLDADDAEAVKKLLTDYPSSPLRQGTPNGLHVFYRLPDKQTVRNATAIDGKIDIRGEGGYIMISPSTHPSGKPYTLDEDVTWDALDDLPVLPSNVLKKANVSRSGSDSMPFTSTDSEWQKTLEEKSRELTNHEGQRNDSLNRIAFSLGQSVGTQYSRIPEAEITLLNAAEKIGLSYDESLATIQSGLLGGLRKPRPINRDETTPSMSFGSICPLGHPTPPILPLELFPEPIADFAHALSEDVQICTNFTIAACLAATSVACQGRLEVQVKDSYIEPVNLFIMSALRPGERKSAVVSAVKKPIKQWEKEMADRLQIPILRIAHERTITQQSLKKMQKESVSTEDPNELNQLIERMSQVEANMPEQAHAPDIFFDDCTPEALAILMLRQFGMAAHIEAEGGFFDNICGKYSQVPNMDLILKAFCIEEVKVARITRDPVIISNPTLTLAVFPQPAVIRGLARKEGFRDKGLIGRFLFFVANSRLGTRKMGTSIPTTVQEKYNRLMQELLEIGFDNGYLNGPTPHKLHLSNEARKVWIGFQAEVEGQFLPDGRLAWATDFGGKLPGAVIRISALFHALLEGKECTDRPISYTTMCNAVEIGRLLIDHMLYTIEDMGFDKKTECAQAIHNWLKSTGKLGFTQREANEKVKGRFKPVSVVEQGLQTLIDHGYIKQAPTPQRVGRPTRRFLVNPESL